MIFLCPSLHCKALRSAMYKRYINSIIIIIIIIPLLLLNSIIKNKFHYYVYAWPFIHSLYFFTRVKITCVRTEKLRYSGNPPLVLKC